jgi:2-polyprenyl-3-methyl-5-hydroxy-6-metoxy-1,4-benzoquinol methylase
VERWRAEFNVAEPLEIAYFRGAIERFGQPALDLGCGAGRLLLPLLADGLIVDGVDISADSFRLPRSTPAGRAVHRLCTPGDARA